MDMSYIAYMTEQDDRKRRLNSAIKDFISYARKGYNINGRIQETILKKHGFSLYNLSSKERNEIKREVERVFNN